MTTTAHSETDDTMAAAIATVCAQPSFNRQQVQELAKQELNIFAPLLLPDTCTLPFPDYYRSLFMDMMASLQRPRSFDKYGLGFPRGHCKTVFAKILAASAIANTAIRFILVVCSNQDRAKDFIRDVFSSLDEPNFRKVYGNWREDVRVDKAEFKQFMFKGRLIAVAAAGVGTSVRGFNVDNQRPDFILLDDAQTRECATSIADSKSLQEWFFATLMKAKSPTRCTYLYIGNMYRDVKITDQQYACLMRNLQLSPYWRTYITGAILADGTALWEELHPISQLLEEYAHDYSQGQGELFAAEVLNDPTYKPKTGLDVSKLRVRDSYEGELHQGNFIIIDPAGRKRKSDNTAILYGKLFDGIPYAYNIHCAKMTPLATIEYAVNLALREGCTVIGVEAVAYQETLIYWFELYCEQQNIQGLEIVPLATGRESKNERILQSFKQANGREIGFTREALAIWLAAANMFDALKTDNRDDELDVVAYMPQMLYKYGQLMTIAGQSSLAQQAIQHDASASQSQCSF
jgi:hypothetical protein